MSMDALGVTITKTLNLRQYLVIEGATSCTSDLYAPNMYTKTQVDNDGVLKANQATTYIRAAAEKKTLVPP